ncbi:aminotransferase [Mesorhizobium sp. 113-3-9]|uniref:aminotransferase-like domain-containing protein n=1 Tax=Mesorhizobium sp. 113-3-9 TaxID=2744517 RepID=UPI0019296799|nr:PLP-dependent aminotransferase family protein [Mesorhizobium sp. 113-3-9]BCG85462.1 aminotransferase [Mesorhizobium sp. 113-3-9]
MANSHAIRLDRLQSDLIEFNRGVPPSELIPTQALGEITREVLAEHSRGLFQYARLGGFRGDPELINEISRFHGADSETIFVGNGSLQVLDLLARILLQSPNPTVLVECPTYDRSIAIFKRLGARVIGISLSEDGIDIDALARHFHLDAPSFLYMIPDFQNPSGVTTSMAKRKQILRLASEFKVPLVEDIPYRELRYEGHPPPLMRELCQNADVFTVGSLSKILSPGLRIGYVIGDPAKLKAVAALAENTYLSPPPLTQAIAARAFSSDLVVSTIANLRVQLRPKWQAAIAATRRQFGSALLTAPEGGYFLGLRFPFHIDETNLIARARENGLTLARGSAFLADTGDGKQSGSFLRLPFQELSPSDFALGAARLAELMHSLH